MKNLKQNHLKINQIVADAAYSSGEALKYCEENNIDAYIPNFGRYKPEREGFVYNEELDQYECQQGNKATLPLHRANVKNGSYLVKRYSSSKATCNDYPFLEKCCGKKTKYKKLDDSIHKEYYDRMHKKLRGNKEYSQRLYRNRASTVEPVLGTLINFLNMRRVNTRGIELASKHVLPAALIHNLKKYLRFINKPYMTNTMAMPARKQVNILNYPVFLPVFLSLLIFMVFSE
jgi:hypothetical protein